MVLSSSVDTLPAKLTPALRVVDGELSDTEGLIRPGPLAQGRLDSGHELRRRERLDHVIGRSALRALAIISSRP